MLCFGMMSWVETKMHVHSRVGAILKGIQVYVESCVAILSLNTIIAHA